MYQISHYNWGEKSNVFVGKNYSYSNSFQPYAIQRGLAMSSMTIKGKSLSRFEKNSHIQPEGCKLGWKNSSERRRRILSGQSKKRNHKKVNPCWPFYKLHDAWHFCLFRSPCDIFLVGLFSINPEVGHVRVFCSLPEEMRSPNDCNPASGKCLSLPLVTIVNTHTKTNTSRTGRKRLWSLRTKELYTTPTQLLLKGSPSRGDILMISPARGWWVGGYKYRKFLTPPTPGIAATH